MDIWIYGVHIQFIHHYIHQLISHATHSNIGLETSEQYAQKMMETNIVHSLCYIDIRIGELNTKVTSTSDPEEILFLKRLKVCLGLIANCN